jgi:hypothetical protein
MGGFEDNVKHNIKDVLINIITEEEEDVAKLLEVNLFLALIFPIPKPNGHCFYWLGYYTK